MLNYTQTFDNFSVVSPSFTHIPENIENMVTIHKI